MDSPRFRVTIQHSPATATRRAARDDYRAGNYSYLVEADSIAEAVARIRTDKVDSVVSTTRIVAVEELPDWAPADYSDAEITDLLQALDYEPDGSVPELSSRSGTDDLPFLDHEAIIDIAAGIVDHLSGFHGVTLTPDPDGDAVILEVFDVATGTYRGNTIETKRLSRDPYAEGYDGLLALAHGVIDHVSVLV